MPPPTRKGDGHVKQSSAEATRGSGDATKPATAPHLLQRDAPLVAAPATAKRSRGHKLTSQFHWNLNHNALECLSPHDRAALYQLFRFYDSSFQGDALPAIHCHRFLELLRDAELLSTCGSDQELCEGTVENVFAQVVLGKLRAYLDADEQPALTFPLFCGALFSCAEHKFGDDATPPETAFQKLVDTLLAAQPHHKSLSASSGHGTTERGRGLVEHSERATIPSWSVQELHGHEERTNGTAVDDPSAANYLHRCIFQDVLAGLSHDPRVDTRLQERLESLYTVPEELKSHFHSDHLAFVTARFRTFDVFDKGVVPRDEIFALLSGVAKRLEIVDVYEVLAVILAGVTDFPTVDRRAMPRGSLVLTMPSPVTHVTLVQILQALHVCRRSRSAAYAMGNQHGQHQRKATGAAAAAGTTVIATGSSARTEDTNGSQRAESKTTSGIRPARGDKRTRTRAAGNLKPQVAVGGKAAATRPAQPAHRGSTTTGGGGKREKKVGKTHAPANDHAAVGRRLSKMSATSSEASASPCHATTATDYQELYSTEPQLASIVGPEHVETEAEILRHDSFQSIHSSCSSSASSVSPVVKGQASATTLASVSSLSSVVSVVEQGDAPCDETQTHDAPPVLTLRMYYRHQTAPIGSSTSGDVSLDGSVCLTISLILSSSPGRVVTTQGVYYQDNGDRRDVWSTQTQKIDARLPLEGAVVVVRRIVAAKERDGFVLIPESAQRDAMDTLEQRMRAASCPGYAMGVQRTHSSRHREALVALPSPSPDHGYRLRRGGLVNKPSLDRGSTWVRQKSSSDLLAMVSDSLLQSHLKMKKRQSLLPATTTLDPSGAANSGAITRSSLRFGAVSPTIVAHALSRAGRPPEEENYSQLMVRWGLHQPQQHEWVTALNSDDSLSIGDNSDMRIGGSASLPSLTGPMEGRSAGICGTRRAGHQRASRANLAPIIGSSRVTGKHKLSN